MNKNKPSTDFMKLISNINKVIDMEINREGKRTGYACILRTMRMFIPIDISDCESFDNDYDLQCYIMSMMIDFVLNSNITAQDIIMSNICIPELNDEEKNDIIKALNEIRHNNKNNKNMQ